MRMRLRNGSSSRCHLLSSSWFGCMGRKSHYLGLAMPGRRAMCMCPPGAMRSSRTWVRTIDIMCIFRVVRKRFLGRILRATARRGGQLIFVTFIVHISIFLETPKCICKDNSYWFENWTAPPEESQSPSCRSFKESWPDARKSNSNDPFWPDWSLLPLMYLYFVCL